MEKVLRDTKERFAFQRTKTFSYRREPRLCSFFHSMIDFDTNTRVTDCSGYFLEVLPVPPNRFR